MHQPLSFRDPTRLDHICLIRKSLYGFKQALRAWCQQFADFLILLVIVITPLIILFLFIVMVSILLTFCCM